VTKDGHRKRREELVSLLERESGQTWGTSGSLLVQKKNRSKGGRDHMRRGRKHGTYSEEKDRPGSTNSGHQGREFTEECCKKNGENTKFLEPREETQKETECPEKDGRAKKRSRTERMRREKSKWAHFNKRLVGGGGGPLKKKKGKAPR